MSEPLSPVRVGGIEVDRESALVSARDYLSRRDRFGYPAYDSFGSEGGPWRISDADLVAPVLLNAQMNSRTFYALEGLRGHLESWLTAVPLDARLVEAGPAELDLLGQLFAPLDDEKLPVAARGAILAKVMHRKRPAFIPLYDRFVDYCYRGDVDAPIRPDRSRGWREFVPMLGRAITDDLIAERDFFTEIATLAQGPVITPLRALDIVAWYAGRSRIGPAIWAAPSGAVEQESDEIEIPPLEPDDEAP